MDRMLVAERAKARAGRNGKVQEINQLDPKIKAQLQKVKERREAAEREPQVKVQVAQGKSSGR